jgi:hypothetical protein
MTLEYTRSRAKGLKEDVRLNQPRSTLDGVSAHTKERVVRVGSRRNAAYRTGLTILILLKKDIQHSKLFSVLIHNYYER